MLVRLGLDTDALAEVDEPSIPERALHRELVNFLRLHGWLVLANDADRERLIDVVRGMPESVKQHWIAALTAIPLSTANPPVRELAKIGGLDEVRLNWAKRTAVVFVRDTLASACGVRDNEACTTDTLADLEICRLLGALEARCVQRVTELRGCEVASGMARDDVWRQRIAPLAAVSRQLVIVDRYAGARQLAASRRLVTGLHWALERLDAGPPVSIHLITQGETEAEAARIRRRLEQLRGRLTRGGVTAIELTVASKPVFREHAHPRHLRFGPDYAITLDRGLELFDTPIVTQGTPCLYGEATAARRREDEVISRAYAAVRRTLLQARL